MKFLECPENAFGIWSIKSLVVIFKVNPTSLTSNVGFPLFGVFQNRGTTVVIELINTELLNLRSSRDL